MACAKTRAQAKLSGAHQTGVRPPPPKSPLAERARHLQSLPDAAYIAPPLMDDLDALPAALTPAAVAACWLRLFPACPRAVSARQGAAFARALGDELALPVATQRKVMHSGTHRGATLHCASFCCGSSRPDLQIPSAS